MSFLGFFEKGEWSDDTEESEEERFTERVRGGTVMGVVSVDERSIMSRFGLKPGVEKEGREPEVFLRTTRVRWMGWVEGTGQLTGETGGSRRGWFELGRLWV
jgi:hypothetical protein